MQRPYIHFPVLKEKKKKRAGPFENLEVELACGLSKDGKAQVKFSGQDSPDA